MFLSLSSSRWPPALLGNESPKSAFVDPITSLTTSGSENHLRTSAGASIDRNSSARTPVVSTSRQRLAPSVGTTTLEPEVLTDYQLGKRTRNSETIVSSHRSSAVAEIWSTAASAAASSAVPSPVGSSRRQQMHGDKTDRQLYHSESQPTLPLFGLSSRGADMSVTSAVGDNRAEIGLLPTTSLATSAASPPSVTSWRPAGASGAADDGSGNAINGAVDGYSLSPLANLLTSLVATNSSVSTINKWYPAPPPPPPSIHQLPLSPVRPWLDPAPWYHLFPGGSSAAQRHLLQVAVAAAATAAAATGKPWRPLLGSDPVAGSLHIRDIAAGSNPSSSSTSNAVMATQPVPGIGGMAKRLFGCPQCRYLTDRKNNLKRHVTTMHQESAGKTLECCAVQFRSKAALRDHVTIFHGAGYTCRHCARNFCRKALLKRHLAVHSGQKDYTCSRCDYATSHKSNLERHKKVHERAPHQTTTGGATVEQEMESSDDGCDNNANALHLGPSVDNDSSVYRRRVFGSEQRTSPRSVFDGVVGFSHHLNRHFDSRTDDVTPETDVVTGRPWRSHEPVATTSGNSMFSGLAAASSLPGNVWQSGQRSNEHHNQTHNHNHHHHHRGLSQPRLSLHLNASRRYRHENSPVKTADADHERPQRSYDAQNKDFPNYSPDGSSCSRSSAKMPHDAGLGHDTDDNASCADVTDEVISDDDDDVTVTGNDVIANDDDDEEEEINVVDDLVS